ncbi:MAG: hypothetical protein WBC78_23645 [Candidatus Sulfotelmatobacter sp.]
MEFEKIAVTSVPSGRCFEVPSAVGLSCIALTLLISVVVCGSAAAQATGCPLNSPGGNISHIVYIQFDNLHLERDNPNVPSDLEQMPNLLNFITGNGTLHTNHHTPLISHTADDILTSLTGVYPDRHGQAVANSFVAENLSTNKFWDNFPSSFTYWTDQVETNPTEDTAFSMITPEGLNAPAPWVPYTRAGCNVGAVSIANMELENVSSDIKKVYGDPSPQLTEAETNFNQAVADFEGISIHCALGNALCTTAGNVVAEPDVLPDEPGGYSGYMGLFGHKYVQPAIAPSGLNDLNGNPITGFPGFSGISPAQALAYDEAMLENGVPIVFTYISDAHDCHSCSSDLAFGPGQPGYEAQLQAYNAAFGKFFSDLAAVGIDSSNTLFVISADEQDHFVGGPASPAGCDGVHVPCNYVYPNGTSSIGEVEGDLAQLYQQQFPNLIPSASAATSGLSTTAIFDYHFDMAPAVSLDPYNPSNTPAFARELERATAQLTGLNPITGKTDQLTLYLVDNPGLQALHMVTGDPARTPTYVMFANTDWFFESQGPIIEQSPGFAYNHGGVAPEINTTWVGMVGPGVKNVGRDNITWSDHTDIRPTMLLLTGLTDDYISDGRVLSEDLAHSALPPALRSSLPLFELLASTYKQITAPVGNFGQGALHVSTVALASGTPSNDSKYLSLESRLTQLTARRDALANQIKSLLDAAEFHGVPLNPQTTLSLSFDAGVLLLDMDILSLTAK